MATLLACAPDLPSTGATPFGLAGTVTAVHDGDTIDVEVDGSTHVVRLLGIDTPEKAGGPRPAECFGQEATEFAEGLLPLGTEVLLARDVETRDQFGRLLAWVHRQDGVFVNLVLVETGHAEPLFFAPNDALEPLFTTAGNHARRDMLGFWTACGAADIVIPR